MDRPEKLISIKSPAQMQVVLVEPEIPPNTGAIARTCVATESHLHLVGRLGFDIDDRAVRRAGLDYWKHLALSRHANLSACKAAMPSARVHLFSSHASRSYLDADFLPGDALVFGKESSGLSEEILASHPERIWAIPTWGRVRSLNLSNAVAIVVYEALRKVGALDGVRPLSSSLRRPEKACIVP